MAKTFCITKTTHRNNSTIEFNGTVSELVESFAYTLECGASYSREKGNVKINRKPTTITSLISNLNNAVNNSAANGYGGVTFAAVEEQNG